MRHPWLLGCQSPRVPSFPGRDAPSHAAGVPEGGKEGLGSERPPLHLSHGRRVTKTTALAKTVTSEKGTQLPQPAPSPWKTVFLNPLGGSASSSNSSSNSRLGRRPRGGHLRGTTALRNTSTSCEASRARGKPHWPGNDSGLGAGARPGATEHAGRARLCPELLPARLAPLRRAPVLAGPGPGPAPSRAGSLGRRHPLGGGWCPRRRLWL